MVNLVNYNEDILSFALILKQHQRLNHRNYDELTARVRQTVAGSGKASWKDFRTNAVKALWENYGLHVAPGAGYGGTLGISALTLPYTIGESLAQQMLPIAVQNGVDGLQADQLLYERLNGLQALEECNVEIILDSFRNGFREYQYKNRQLRFHPGPGWSFYIARAEIRFNGGNENKMTGLAIRHVEARLRERWGGIETVAKALGSRRRFGPLQNVDAFVLGKQQFPDKDQLYMAAIEAKRSNKPADLFGALRQAVSYKAFANEVWIMAPGLSADEYGDAAQHEQLLESCRDHGFGVMNIQLSNDGKEIMSVAPILSPKSCDIRVPTLLNEVLEKERWERCVLCRKYYSASIEMQQADNSDLDQIPANCGWTNNDGLCMRVSLERLTQ